MTSRNQSLDVLRGLAILLVLGHHFPAESTLVGAFDATSRLPIYLRAWHAVGWTGVELFFVLSGYLISGLLFEDYERHGRIRLGRFMFRRFMKIWPPLYVLLAVLALLFAYRPERFPWRSFLSSALFYRNYLPLHTNPSVLSHTWSLGVEEHFYLLLPVLLMFLVARKGRNSGDPFSSLPWIFCGLVLVSSLLRGVSDIRTASHVKMDSLFAGVFLRYVHMYRPAWFAQLARPHWLLAVPFLWSAAFIPAGFLRYSAGFAGLYLGFGLLLAWAVMRTPRGSVAKVIAGIGEYSYSIYLWHVPVVMIVCAWKVSAMAFWVYVACALAVGIAMSKLVEMPALRVRDAVTGERRPALRTIQTLSSSRLNLPAEALADSNPRRESTAAVL